MGGATHSLTLVACGAGGSVRAADRLDSRSEHLFESAEEESEGASMRIGRFVEVLDIVPDETPGLEQDWDGEREFQDPRRTLVGACADSAEDMRGRSAAYAS